jgi:uncharacterized membrane protein
MRKKIKQVLWTGIVAVIPIGVTVYIFFFLISMMDSILAIIPEHYHPDVLIGFHIPGLGVILIILLTFLIGLITKSYLGKKVIDWGENLVNKIPVVRNIYQPTKQLVDSMFTGGVKNFNRVVLIEFPRKGVYTIGFVTGLARGEIRERIGKDCINVYVPTTPNPTSGYFVVVAERELINLDMSVEEAFRMIISVGLVVPEHGAAGKVTTGSFF